MPGKRVPKTRAGLRARRHLRVRAKVAGTAERPRLVVFRSLKHVSAQLVDDVAKKTLMTVTDAGLTGKKSVKSVEVGKRVAEKAKAAYGRAIQHAERSIAAMGDRRDQVDHFVALALAGRARLAFEQGDDESALADVLASFERSPASAGSIDGLSFTPASTGIVLLARLKDAKRDDLSARLDAALAKLDPALLVPPAEFPRPPR